MYRSKLSDDHGSKIELINHLGWVVINSKYIINYYVDDVESKI